MEKKQLFKLGLRFRAKQIVKNIKSWSEEQNGDLVDVEAVCVNTLQYDLTGISNQTRCRNRVGIRRRCCSQWVSTASFTLTYSPSPSSLSLGADDSGIDPEETRPLCYFNMLAALSD